MRQLVSVILFLLILGGVAHAMPLSVKKMAVARTGVVHTDNESGSAFNIGGEYWYTAGHVAYATGIHVNGHDAKIVTAGWVCTSGFPANPSAGYFPGDGNDIPLKFDWALLITPGYSPNPKWVDQADPIVNDPVFYYSWKTGDLIKSNASKVTKDEIQINTYAALGDSGSVLLNENGAFEGILVSRDRICGGDSCRFITSFVRPNYWPEQGE